jgi:hypothetical protein
LLFSDYVNSPDKYCSFSRLHRRFCSQEGEDLDDLLAEIEEELPEDRSARSPSTAMAAFDEDGDVGRTSVQKKVGLNVVNEKELKSINLLCWFDCRVRTVTCSFWRTARSGGSAWPPTARRS